MTQKTLSITGMTCGHCVEHVKKALEDVDGVDGAEVSLDANEAVVYGSTDISEDALTGAVKAAGYDANLS